MKEPKYFYQITVEKPGGLVMPIIIEYTYADGTSETVTHPAEIWRLNDKEVSLSKATQKEIVGIVIDPKLETADIDTSNNSWPQEPKVDKFEEMKQ
ncbi:Zn-dependent aminopeptidase [Nonlabens ulvanivorans]|nr:Zn-dependent aminopeptidase [Nonlabens ulvanivorans]